MRTSPTSCFTVTGVNGSRRPRMTARATRMYGTSTRRASRCSSRIRVALSFGRSLGQTWIAVPATLETSTRPLRSRIGPRGACTRTVRSWLFWAARRYSVPFRTCSAQSRSSSTAKTVSVSIPRTPIRSAIRGVRRYGSAVRGSGGRNRRDLERSAKQPDLGGALGPLGRRQDPPDRGVHRECDQEVEEDGRHERVDEHGAGRGVLPEHEVEHQRADREQDADDGDREQRRVAAVAAGRLPVAADPVADERVQERIEAERPERPHVVEEPGGETGGRAED